MLKKLTLGLLLSISAVSTMAAMHSIPSSAGSTTKVDISKVKMQSYPAGYGEESNYFESRISVEYAQPKKLNTGDYYTKEFYTLSVDCQNKEYAATDYAWYINGKLTKDNNEIALSGAWKAFNFVPKSWSLTKNQAAQYNQQHIRASFICSQMIG